MSNNLISKSVGHLLIYCFLIFGSFNFIQAQVDGDTPCGAIEISALEWDIDCDLSNNFLANYGNATDSGYSIPGCSDGGFVDLWFTFSIPTDGFHLAFEIISELSGPYGYEIYEGTDCNNLASEYCLEVEAGHPITFSDGYNHYHAGKQLWVRFWDNGGDSADLHYCLKKITPNYNSNLGSCGESPHAADECVDAIIWDDELNGYCGNTENFTAGSDELQNIFPAFRDNTGWIGFKAPGDSIAIALNTFNCVFGNGTQAMILATDDCVNFRSASNFINIGIPGTDTLTAGGLIPGDTYYILVDGWGGDICDYTLNYIYGSSSTITQNYTQSVCSGQSLQLTFDALPSGNYIYNWSEGVAEADRHLASPEVFPTDNFVYTCEVSGDLELTITIEVTVFDSLDLAPIAPIGTCENTFDLSGLTIVNGSSVSGIISYYENEPDAQTANNHLGNPIITESGTYWIRMETSSGCYGITSVIVILNDMPDISIITDLNFCEGSFIDLSQLDFLSVFNINEVLFFENYELAEIGNPAQRISNPIVQNAVMLFARITTEDGCIAIIPVDLEMINAPWANIGFTNTGNVYSFFPVIENSDIFYWDFGDGTTSTVLNPTHEFQNAGTYNVNLFVENDCGSVSVYVDIAVIISSNNNLEELSKLSVFPNPSVGYFQVMYDGLNQGLMAIDVFDILGKKVQSLNLESLNSNNNIIDLSQQVPGTYLLRITDDQHRERVEKLILQR